MLPSPSVGSYHLVFIVFYHPVQSVHLIYRLWLLWLIISNLPFGFFRQGLIWDGPILLRGIKPSLPCTRESHSYLLVTTWFIKSWEKIVAYIFTINVTYTCIACCVGMWELDIQTRHMNIFVKDTPDLLDHITYNPTLLWQWYQLSFLYGPLSFNVPCGRECPTRTAHALVFHLSDCSLGTQIKRLWGFAFGDFGLFQIPVFYWVFQTCVQLSEFFLWKIENIIQIWIL